MCTQLCALPSGDKSSCVVIFIVCLVVSSSTRRNEFTKQQNTKLFFLNELFLIIFICLFACQFIDLYGKKALQSQGFFSLVCCIESKDCGVYSAIQVVKQ